MSVDGSRPTTWAFTGSCFPKRTVTSFAPETTCEFVRMWPDLSRTKPEPVAVPRCGGPKPGISELSVVVTVAWTNATPGPTLL